MNTILSVLLVILFVLFILVIFTLNFALRIIEDRYIITQKELDKIKIELEEAQEELKFIASLKFKKYVSSKEASEKYNNFIKEKVNGNKNI